MKINELLNQQQPIDQVTAIKQQILQLQNQKQKAMQQYDTQIELLKQKLIGLQSIAKSSSIR